MKAAMVFSALAALALPAALFAQSPAAAPAADYTAAPVAGGSWRYVPVAGGSDARFIDATATIRLTIHCTRATRRVMISHTSAVPASSMAVWTSSAARTLPGGFDPKGMRVSAEVAATDPLLDAIAFSRGRFAVSLPGSSALVVPAWPETARAIEDCRI